ncbi:MAG: hypothetical protein N2651_08565, partial [Fimbriimonadales bacterium]|nr:hypothetical protein [Fimbriimonadales bacterium]
GKSGFRELSETCTQKAHYAAGLLTQIPGVRLKYPNTPFYKEFVLTLPRPAQAVSDALLERNIIAGLPLGEYDASMQHDLLVCVTEARTREEIEAFAKAMAGMV